jgi:Protein of unknown function (DUF3631)/Domain of unknown function (DUF3854)
MSGSVRNLTDTPHDALPSMAIQRGNATMKMKSITDANLTAADMKMFESLRIPLELVAAAGIMRVTDQQAREEFGITGHGDMSGLMYPYRIPGNGNHRSTCRLRRDHSERESGKPKNKYMAPYGDVRRLYFGPYAEELLQDPHIEIVFVESAKSVLALVAWSRRNGLPLLPIGTGGCWNWRGRIGKCLDATGMRVDETGPLPDLACVKGRKVYILFDSNATTNPYVQSARHQFARELYKLGATSVVTLDLPQGDWNGPDDYIASAGDDAMQKVFTGMPSTNHRSEPTPVAPPSPRGNEILDKVYAFLRRFVALSQSQARVIALWAVHTHALPAADATPYLAITSPEKQSGKTRSLEILELIVAEPWLTGRATPAVLYRKIAEKEPSLLLDESDAAFGGDRDYAEALRAILNTGHRRGGKASCCVRQGGSFTSQDFSTFCPKAIAGIGNLPDTVADRAIPIRLKRAARGERIERFRERTVKPDADRLRDAISSWAKSITQQLRDARPILPEELTDRQQDGAEPLLAIADAAGMDWPEAARQAFIELCTDAQSSDGSTGWQLLLDIRNVFESSGVDRLSSEELAGALVDIETSPWAEFAHGKRLTKMQLAKLLKPYGIAPECMRIGDKTLRGYQVQQFQDAFRRYLRDSYPPPQGATPQQSAVYAASSDFPGCNNEVPVAVQKCKTANENAACCTVAPPRPSTDIGAKGIEEEL